MDIKQLVAEAQIKSPTFNAKYIYWTITRNKQPELDWLMENLEEALGWDYVQKAAYDHIASRDTYGET